jgi:hypothetical protein
MIRSHVRSAVFVSVAAWLALAPCGVAAHAIVPVVDADIAGRAPFQASVSLSLQTPYVNVSIPAGKRLIVEHVNVTAYVQSSGVIVPSVVAGVTQAGSAPTNFIYTLNTSPLGTQYALAQQVTLYADALSLSYGYAGTTPNDISMAVSISGHLISVTAP